MRLGKGVSALTRHGRLGLAALALLASLTFVPSAFAGSLVNQIVQKSGTTVTWTGGSQNSGANPDDDAITVTESDPGEVTIVSTSGPITLFPDGPTGDTTTGCRAAECEHRRLRDGCRSLHRQRARRQRHG